MGNITLGWLLFWQAGIAAEKLAGIMKEKGVDAGDPGAVKELVKDHREAAFYQGKIYSVRYYVKHVLPQAKALAVSIKTEDLSCLDIAEESFAL
ncbi:MAG TPA: hypothetical protein ENN21_00190, partial [Spirochaetes bacterium]|nr:hypothetical protein [Spirochaetota bacterium]